MKCAFLLIINKLLFFLKFAAEWRKASHLVACSIFKKAFCCGVCGKKLEAW